MSGIYIKGVEMPKGCAFCKISRRNGNKMICPFIWKCEWDIHDSMAADHRLDDCPLIPVPEHGDLIDRDALGTPSIIMEDTLWRGRIETEVFLAETINDAPTVIPADIETMFYSQVDGITPSVVKEVDNG